MKNFLKSKEFLQFCKSAFDNVPVAIDFLDEEGTMIYINQAFSDFLEIPIEEMINRKVTDINPTSKFMESLQSKKSDIAARHFFQNGKDAICHRIVIMDGEENLYGGMGMILFDHVNDMKEMIKKYEQLDKKIEMYKREIASQNRTKYTLSDIRGVSRGIEKCKKEVRKIAKLNINTLITGESGVGKELFAHSIHERSNRSPMPFVTVNCSAIVENLFESEFFGYEAGAFTGADSKGRMGKFELANGGTLFLDEIGDMPLPMQAKLLRALQEKEIIRVGGSSPIEVDIRVIGATHQNLKEMIEEGKFREDLYYRLNVYNLQIPPLRERPEDIPELAKMILEEFQGENKIRREISDEAMALLQSSRLSGNVRELKNIILKSCIYTESEIIDEGDIKIFLNGNGAVKEKQKDTWQHKVKSTEKEMMAKALKDCYFNKTKAAKMLNMSRTTFYRKMKEYNLQEKEEP